MRFQFAQYSNQISILSLSLILSISSLSLSPHQAGSQAVRVATNLFVAMATLSG